MRAVGDGERAHAQHGLHARGTRTGYTHGYTHGVHARATSTWRLASGREEVTDFGRFHPRFYFGIPPWHVDAEDASKDCTKTVRDVIPAGVPPSASQCSFARIPVSAFARISVSAFARISARCP